MSPSFRGILPSVLMLLAACQGSPAGAPVADWPAYGRDVQGTRHSPAAAVTPENVDRLEPAWTFRTGETGPEFETEEPASLQATPIVVDGVMYLSTPLGRIFALDPGTGDPLWTFDPEIRRDVGYGDFASRGVATWLDDTVPADAPCRRTIYHANAQSQLVALDAATGTPCPGFGRDGKVDLLEGLRIPPFEPGAYSMTSPPVVANGIVVLGSSIADNSRPNPASGEIRGFDARTGALRWSWDPIPQSATDPAYGDWTGTMAHESGGANAWSVLSADPGRDLVFVPTTSPSPDYYGVMRLGQNRHANSIAALRISTGELAWSFQTVHHDLWDYDNASPPALTTVVRQGEQTAVVLQATKTGMLFVLDRETGQPVYSVEERRVPESDIPSEEAWPTQPFTTATPPLSPHRLEPGDAWGMTETDQSACRATISGLRNEGIFTPPSTRGTLVIPSNIGGAHWGGVAVDPERQIAVVPVNRIASMVQLIPREDFDPERFSIEDERLGHDYEYNMMQGTPYVMRRRVLYGPSGLPCSPPPWGSLVAVDLSTGERLWDVPLGSMTGAAPPDAAEELSPEWGSINLGGPITTAAGLVFIGATLDRRLHAFDIETGEELWQGELPGSARATPMTYQLPSGDQYVVVSVGGGEPFGTGDHVVAFRLRMTDDVEQET